MAFDGIKAYSQPIWRGTAHKRACSTRPMASRWVVIGALVAGVGCKADRPAHFASSEPLWVDTDRHPFSPRPKKQELEVAWDGFDSHIFAPISHALRVEPAGEAQNVNSWDEVPNSSWFQNRIGWGRFSPEQMASGPCDEAPPDPSRFTVTSAKPDGANPGFFVEDAQGRGYVIKFGGTLQGPRAIAASTVGSRIFHAAGFNTPCNRVIYLRREELSISPDATVERGGEERPVEEEDVDRAFEIGLRLRDGRYQAVASRMVEGEPLGPWRYYGLRKDDYNDIIPHQNRRELRGMRLLSALIGHYDSRDGNTLTSWIATDEHRGYVRHYIIDFGESFGSLWWPPGTGRQINQAAYVDLPKMMADWWTLGLIHRPYRTQRFGPSGRVFGYYDVAHFEPASWETGYPNPAFDRMSVRDGAWMARIIAHFSDEHFRETVAVADMRDPFLDQELLRLLAGRRDKILDRYLTTLSPLAHPSIQGRGDRSLLCLVDLLSRSERVAFNERTYRFVLRVGGRPEGADDEVAISRRELARGAAEHRENSILCVPLAAAFVGAEAVADYLVVEVDSGTRNEKRQPLLRVHLRQLLNAQKGKGWQVVGLQRSMDEALGGG